MGTQWRAGLDCFKGAIRLCGCRARIVRRDRRESWHFGLLQHQGLDSEPGRFDARAADLRRNERRLHRHAHVTVERLVHAGGRPTRNGDRQQPCSGPLPPAATQRFVKEGFPMSQSLHVYPMTGPSSGTSTGPRQVAHRGTVSRRTAARCTSRKCGFDAH